MQHSWHADVLHVHLPARHLVNDVDARYPRANELIAARRLLRRGAGELDTERLVAEQVAVFDRTAADLAINRHDALGYRQAANLHAKPGRRNREQRLARLRRCRPKLRAAAVDRRA